MCDKNGNEKNTIIHCEGVVKNGHGAIGVQNMKFKGLQESYKNNRSKLGTKDLLINVGRRNRDLIYSSSFSDKSKYSDFNLKKQFDCYGMQ